MCSGLSGHDFSAGYRYVPSSPPPPLVRHRVPRGEEPNLNGVEVATYDKPVEQIDHFPYTLDGKALHNGEALLEKMRRITAPVLKLTTKEGKTAYLARVREAGNQKGYVLYTDRCLRTDDDYGLPVSAEAFDTKGYFERLCRGEPCGKLSFSDSPSYDIFRFKEGPKLVDVPYVYKSFATYVFDCCRALCYGSEKMSSVVLDQPKPQPKQQV